MANPKVEHLEIAIQRLVEVLDSHGSSISPRRLEGKGIAAAGRSVDEVAAAINPRTLPVEIEWFWRTWDPYTFGDSTGMIPLIAPDFALEAYVEDDAWPRALFWIAYSSHSFLAVELEYPGSATSLVFDDCYGGVGLDAIAPNLATWISACAAEIERHPGIEVLEILADGDTSVKATCRDALSVAGVTTGERGPFDWSDHMSCPKRWQEQQWLDEAPVVLLGATHTIGQLQHARRSRRLNATIRGRMRNLAGGGRGGLSRISDSSGDIEVWIPLHVPRLGRTQDQVFEVDVTAERFREEEPRMSDSRPDVSGLVDSALSADLESIFEYQSNLSAFFESDFPVVVTAIRPTEF